VYFLRSIKPVAGKWVKTLVISMRREEMKGKPRRVITVPSLQTFPPSRGIKKYASIGGKGCRKMSLGIELNPLLMPWYEVLVEENIPSLSTKINKNIDNFDPNWFSISPNSLITHS
jgi:hypothetical protein